MLDASRLADDDGPVTPLMPGRRRGLVSGQDPANEGGGKPVGGGTLFERMANLSRGTKAASENEDDEDDDGNAPSISIPRFLGRQNNQ